MRLKTVTALLATFLASASVHAQQQPGQPTDKEGLWHELADEANSRMVEALARNRALGRELVEAHKQIESLKAELEKLKKAAKQ